MSDAPLSFRAHPPLDRLDRWLAVAYPTFSRSRWKSLIEAGHVTLNDLPHRIPRTPLKDGDEIRCIPPPPAPVGLIPADIPLTILYEDADILVLDKPPGLVVHPAPGHSADTLVNALLHHCGDFQGIGGELRPGIVHRLDKDTSGAMVVAKNETALASLVDQFSARTPHKTYLALVWGRPVPATAIIDRPIGRHPVHRQKWTVTPKGRPALTRYETVASGPLASLLRLHIETGRTHQIRVHMAALTHPVVGDTLYGRARHNLPPDLLLPRQMLHARRLTLRHPRTAEEMTFLAPLPPDFLSAAQILIPDLPPLLPTL